MRVECRTVGLRSIYEFYRDGFCGMTLGRTLWCVIFVKLAVIFGLLRVFYFEPTLQGSVKESSRSVATELANRISN